MDIVTKMQVNVPKENVFEAFVNPSQIGGFWFSSSSERWEQGKTITLCYEEYNAELEVQINSIEDNKSIEFIWGNHPVTIEFEGIGESTVVTTIEKDFDTQDVEQLLGQKEGGVYMLSCLKAYLEHNVSIRAAIL
ncbi:SRPBCC domain-containing protein [Staphylococcus xylosus]|uniref:SRPBCC domain-containing protein n=1 Tax=Staphylococcus xylosus TaxID=1288 RepID=UPI002DBBCAB8|nr:SRPBCC domain-containing protein [Staphylococcus xylosus]MEB7659923.1 SRPBCC domain-containing protein [Staphylococcus xylosus]MEB7709811.1 SRPBCC domain-containing protein [Staphylococcus xylosus]MEB7785562.1 SRPBCC domain-containing protein [Staphylococcus xylosus]